MTQSRKKDQSNRLLYLVRLLNSLSSLRVNSVVVNIFVNDPSFSEVLDSYKLPLKIKYHVFPEYSRMNQLNNSPWIENNPKSPWNLVWEHKKILKNDFERGDDHSIYLYIENDMYFSQQNLEYWLEGYRELNNFSLLPSFLRVEYDSSSKTWKSIDLFNVINLNIRDLPNVKVNGNYYVQLPNTYSGMYLLTQESASEHISSRAFSKSQSRELIWWDLGARSTCGDQFINIPKGFNSRHVIKLDGEKLEVDAGCVIHHMPNLYVKTLSEKTHFPDIQNLFYI